MRKFQYFLFMFKRSYICYYIICITTFNLSFSQWSQWNYSRSAFCLRTISTVKSKWLSTKRCSNFIVLLCTAETDRVQRIMKTLAWAYFKSTDCRSMTSVASRTKFFVTTVLQLVVINVNITISTLVALRVLDLPLCEIKNSKLNKAHISEAGYY